MRLKSEVGEKRQNGKIKELIRRLQEWMRDRGKTSLRDKLQKLRDELYDIDVGKLDTVYVFQYLTRYEKLLKKTKKMFPDEDSFDELTNLKEGADLKTVEKTGNLILQVLKSNVNVLLTIFEIEEKWEQYIKDMNELKRLRKENEELKTRLDSIKKY